MKASRSSLAAAATVAALFGVMMIALAGPVNATAPVFLTTSFTPSHASDVAQDGFEGVEITFTNTLTTPQVALIFASLVNQNGETTGVSLFAQNFTAGSQATFFFAFPQAPAGSYTVQMLAVSPGYVPLSVATSVALTV